MKNRIAITLLGLAIFALPSCKKQEEVPVAAPVAEVPVTEQAAVEATPAADQPAAVETPAAAEHAH